MSQKTIMILERSSQNLKKYDDKGKVVLEGVFCVFGELNRNDRLYDEKAYLPHLEYLKADIKSGNLLGELDHPERFEVSLGNVSHRITELWYEPKNRQVKGRIELLDTPKGQIAKSLLEAGVPLSISSRAAGTVNEDKTVDIQQIYTYDLVAKPGFEAAQLKSVSESAKARIGNMVTKLNESADTRRNHDISSTLGIVNENVSILDLSDKFPSVKFRDEALMLQNESSDSNVKNKNYQNQMKENELNENAIQQLTLFYKKELSNINERLNVIESAIVNGNSGNSAKEIKLIKQYVEKLRKVQENSLNWQGDIAKAVNKVANYADTLAEKSNAHFNLTKKVVETVDENAKVLNHTQDWVGKNAKITNAIAETVDHNAVMLNGINEWNTQLAKGVNALHEWGTEKAKAINDIHEWGAEKAKAINNLHEWTASIAKMLNETANWSENMFGRAMSKEDAKSLVEYVELVSESKKNPVLRKKILESLKIHGITGKQLSEGLMGIKGVKGLGTLTDGTHTGNSKVDTTTGKSSDVYFDEKSQTIVSKIKNAKFSKNAAPKGLKTIQDVKDNSNLVKGTKVKGVMTLDTVRGGSKPVVKISGDGPKNVKNQNLKLDTKPEGHLKESLNRSNSIVDRSNSLNEKLSKIISVIEREKTVDNSVKNDFPFTALLNESDRREFAKLSLTDKQVINEEIKRNPSTDANIIKALWENVLAKSSNAKVNSDPLWLKTAPKEYKLAYQNATSVVKESIKARSEFYPLETQYQINNFWETTGLTLANKNRVSSLNEVYTAKSPAEKGEKMDSFISQIGEAMKKYQK
jgi:hypothetical protein